MDSAGNVVVRPADGVSGTLGYSVDWPDGMRSVCFEGSVSAKSTMCSLFLGCAELESADLSSLDASDVKDMSLMFKDCSSLAPLDLTGFGAVAASDTSSMFTGRNECDGFSVHMGRCFGG